MQAYVHELGECLLRVDDDKHGVVNRRLILLSVEGMRLVGRRLLQNPAAHKALLTANLVQGQPTLLHLDADFYTNLVVGFPMLMQWYLTCLSTVLRLKADFYTNLKLVVGVLCAHAMVFDLHV